MTISLGSLTLHRNIYWENEFDYAGIAQQVQISNAGVTLIDTMPIVGGRVIIITAQRLGNSAVGYFTREQVQALNAYEAAGTVVTFVYGDQSIDVVVSANGIKVAPVREMVGHVSTDVYTGSITLREV